jgi:hypothetical protein
MSESVAGFTTGTTVFGVLDGVLEASLTFGVCAAAAGAFDFAVFCCAVASWPAGGVTVALGPLVALPTAVGDDGADPGATAASELGACPAGTAPVESVTGAAALSCAMVESDF